ncbi:Os04g0618100 [Oryza sativa Japonica Group]|uniref:Os04g0618100 protein n=1 Tax=Oryza sativa subsp. japonica TaxID=39947 RepID=A0A0P0WEY7_ORYSJ|nr:hypothetical protein DAI22_04g263100 [Oryza sativa Japonica Group]BAS91032.1 Os04g0618100 [Oryza sativa Japonica Group]
MEAPSSPASFMAMATMGSPMTRRSQIPCCCLHFCQTISMTLQLLALKHWRHKQKSPYQRIYFSVYVSPDQKLMRQEKL